MALCWVAMFHVKHLPDPFRLWFHVKQRRILQHFRLADVSWTGLTGQEVQLSFSRFSNFFHINDVPGDPSFLTGEPGKWLMAPSFQAIKTLIIKKAVHLTLVKTTHGFFSQAQGYVTSKG